MLRLYLDLSIVFRRTRIKVFMELNKHNYFFFLFSLKIVVHRQSANVICIYVILSFVYTYTRANTCVLYPMCMSYVSFLHIFEFTCTVVIMIKVKIEMVIMIYLSHQSGSLLLTLLAELLYDELL